jgi:hypothetical protein
MRSLTRLPPFVTSLIVAQFILILYGLAELVVPFWLLQALIGWFALSLICAIPVYIALDLRKQSGS